VSNGVSIHLTKFATHKIDGSVDYEDWGMRVVDNEDQTYSTDFGREDLFSKSPAELVEAAAGIDSRAADMIAFARENNEGISIGGDYFTWADLSVVPKV
jgi:hypothetical protein